MWPVLRVHGLVVPHFRLAAGQIPQIDPKDDANDVEGNTDDQDERREAMEHFDTVQISENGANG